MGFFAILRHNLKQMKLAKQLSAMGADALLTLDDDAFYDAVECLCDVAVYDINAPELNEPQLFLYALTRFEAEVNNGGLCQFSSFKIERIDDYEAQTQRFAFDAFDERFYEDEHFHRRIIAYGRQHIEQLLEH